MGRGLGGGVDQFVGNVRYGWGVAGTERGRLAPALTLTIYRSCAYPVPSAPLIALQSRAFAQPCGRTGARNNNNERPFTCPLQHQAKP
jgi:hypothetical protein